MSYDQAKISQATTAYRSSFPDDRTVLNLSKTVSSLRDRPGIWDRLVEAMGACVARGSSLDATDCRFVFGNPDTEYCAPRPKAT